MEIPFNKFNTFYVKNKKEILEAADSVLSSGDYIRGAEIEKLEAKLCRICNRKYAVTTASCTDALFFSLKASGITKGDEVIIPDFSYIASLSPVLMCGATPVFADINKEDLTLDTRKIEDLITERTRAIIFVQLFGKSVDLTELKKITKANDIVLIEDSAQALGSETNGIPGGKGGDVSCISFDPTKIVSAFGTGGVLLTDNENIYNKALRLVHHGKNIQNQFETLGYNSKIPELNAAIINMQLTGLANIISSHNEIADNYFNRLNSVKQISLIKPEENQISSFHKFVIKAENRNALQKHLKDSGIETKIHYNTLLHEHKLLKDFPFFRHDTSNAEYAKSKVLSLPVFDSLDSGNIDYICNCIINFYQL